MTTALFNIHTTLLELIVVFSFQLNPINSLQICISFFCACVSFFHALCFYVQSIRCLKLIQFNIPKTTSSSGDDHEWFMGKCVQFTWTQDNDSQPLECIGILSAVCNLQSAFYMHDQQYEVQTVSFLQQVKVTSSIYL